MILYCIRHGEAKHNQNNIMNYDISIPYHLTETGKKQAQEAGKKLKDIKINAVFISEFIRVKETAKIINKFHNLPLKADARLNEFKSGAEGESYQTYLKKREKAAKEQNKDIYEAKVNDGESTEDKRNRVFSFLNDLKKEDYDAALIIAHHDTIQAIYAYIKNLNSKEMQEFNPKKGELYKFELSNKRV